MKKFVSTPASDPSSGAMRACVRREGSRCEKTEEDTEQPIAAPACPSYGTRLSLRDLCVLRAVRAVGSGFRREAGHSARAGAPWVGFSGLETPRDHAHCMRDKVRVINSWQSSCTRLEISVSQRQNSISCTGPGASARDICGWTARNL